MLLPRLRGKSMSCERWIHRSTWQTELKTCSSVEDAVRAWHQAPDLLSFIQDQSGRPDDGAVPAFATALGRRRTLEGLYNLTDDEREFAAALAEVIRDIQTVEDVTSVGIIDAISILYTGYFGDVGYSAGGKMVSSHLMESVLFGLLHEDGQWNYYDGNYGVDDD